ncbi:hypothetical protein [uncultured Litoreibacter sp.]|uniref:hypothetical protein n=1 Tax=uncultured Litoreibacter sp. TaxID=1392394 RepID=UPI0026330DF6|nr:hypothetical protein [uncultured Litoreibacter sp.]
MKRQMELLTAIAAGTIATAAPAQDRDIRPVVYIINDGAAPSYNYDRDIFQNASRQAGPEVSGFVNANDPDVLAKAKAQAVPDDASIIYLSVTNLPATRSQELKPDFDSLSAQIAAKPASEGWQEIAFAPMCRLYAAQPAAEDQIQAAMLAVMDDPNAKLNCYRLAMTYFAGLPDESGNRVMPVYLDSRAMVMQATLPAIEVAEAYLAHKHQRDERGRYKRRESRVYAPKEEIFLRAYLDHVGRDQAGTMFGSYKIDLSMEVRNPDGALLGRTKLHSYQNPSQLFYPLDGTYFWNNITAGVFLEDPGDYLLAFIFEDGSRPGSDPAEVTFPVTISAN